jgi:hypothetical protein
MGERGRHACKHERQESFSRGGAGGAKERAHPTSTSVLDDFHLAGMLLRERAAGAQQIDHVLPQVMQRPLHRWHRKINSPRMMTHGCGCGRSMNATQGALQGNRCT